MSSPTPDNADQPDHPNQSGPPSDADLIEAARAGDTTAYGTLFARHEHAVHRWAECLLGCTAEDLVLFAYTQGFDALRGGSGPTAALRPFLLRVMAEHCAEAETVEPDPVQAQTLDDLYEQTNTAYRLIARTSRPEPWSGTDASREAHDPREVQDEEAEARAALDAAVDAAILGMYDELADDWRLVLWNGEVEGDNPDTLALLLGVHADDALVLRRRARHTMRQFAISHYLAATRPARCRYAVDRLAPYDDGELDRFETEKVAAHLGDCAECALLYEQVRAIASRLSDILARGLLGRLTDAYLDRPSEQRPGWASARLARLREALHHRGRPTGRGGGRGQGGRDGPGHGHGRMLGAFGVVSLIVAAMAGGTVLYVPDITSRPAPWSNVDAWTELPAWTNSVTGVSGDGGEAGAANVADDSEEKEDGTGGAAVRSRNGSFSDTPGERPEQPEPGGTPATPRPSWPTAPSPSAPGSTSPSDPSDPSEPGEPSEPGDPTGEPTDSPTDEPTDDPTTPPPSDDPTTPPPSDDPTGEPTDDPTGDPGDPPSDEPTDEPTDPPSDDDPSSPPSEEATSPSGSATATPSFLRT